jgi:hypothetical protein
MRRWRTSACFGALIALAAAGTAVAAQARTNRPAGGQIQIFVTLQSAGPRAAIVVTGAIGDYGHTLDVDKNGKVDLNGNFEKISLQKGGFLLDSTAFDAHVNSIAPTIDNTTCSGQVQGSGTITIEAGTGLYKGISGSLNATETYAFVAPPYSSGKNKGQCNLSKIGTNAAFGSLTGTGSVSYS